MTVTAVRPVPEAHAVPKPGEIRIRTVEPRRIIEVPGEGRPDSPSFRAAVAALYTVAYGVHFALKRRRIPARVGALEGLWTFDRDPFATAAEAASHVPPNPESWRWRLLIELPADAAHTDVTAAIDDARRRHPSAELEALREVWFEEGLIVEALHVGPYSTEPETVARMAAAAEEAGLVPVGPHHEIYLGDPRRAAPERLKTVLRQPVGPTS